MDYKAYHDELTNCYYQGLPFREEGILSKERFDELHLANSIAWCPPNLSPVYNSNDLISWALQQVFAADLIPHMAAFLDFANKASQPATDNFRAYATAVSQSALAETIIAKAIELGAKIV